MDFIKCSVRKKASEAKKKSSFDVADKRAKRKRYDFTGIILFHLTPQQDFLSFFALPFSLLKRQH
jgi:hypothetical protein